MADLSISVGGQPIEVSIESPTIAVQIDTPSILIPSGDVALIGPPGPAGPTGPAGAPSTVPGPAGPAPLSSVQIFSAATWPYPKNTTGYTLVADASQGWMIPGEWSYFATGSPPTVAGLMRIVSISGAQVNFDSWQPMP